MKTNNKYTEWNHMLHEFGKKWIKDIKDGGGLFLTDCTGLEYVMDEERYISVSEAYMRMYDLDAEEETLDGTNERWLEFVKDFIEYQLSKKREISSLDLESHFGIDPCDLNMIRFIITLVRRVANTYNYKNSVRNKFIELFDDVIECPNIYVGTIERPESVTACNEVFYSIIDDPYVICGLVDRQDRCYVFGVSITFIDSIKEKKDNLRLNEVLIDTIGCPELMEVDATDVEFELGYITQNIFELCCKDATNNLK